MKAHDLLELAGRNLRESVLRNALTTVGISVGIASLVTLLSLGIGLQDLATKRLGRSGLFDVIMVTNRDLRIAGPPPPRNRKPSEPRRALDEAARQEIAKLANVSEVYPDVRFPSQVRAADAPPLAPKDYGSRQQTLIVSGIPESERNREAFTSMKGTFFSGPEAAEAILQADAAKNAFEKPEELLGKTIVIRYAQQQAIAGNPAAASPRDAAAAAAAGADAEMVMSMMGFSVVPKELKLKVVGVTETNPEAGTRGAFGSGIFIPQKLAEQAKPMRPGQLQPGSPVYGDQYTALVVKMKKPEQVEAAEDRIKTMGFSAFSLMDASRSIRQFFVFLDMFLALFGSVALIVASLGIINTLVMAILERRREIGIMKAIGASDGDVRKLFFAEAGSMGVLGGALGVAMGWAIGKIINFGTVIYVQRQQGVTPDNIWSVPLWLVGFAILFSVGVSLAAGLYPAHRAARLDPVQALRYE